jgi:hypothetical protein
MDPNILKAVEKWAHLQNRREELVKELEKVSFEIAQLEKEVPQLGNIKGILGGGTKKKKKVPKEDEEKKEPKVPSKEVPPTSKTPEKTATVRSPAPKRDPQGKRPNTSEEEREASKKMKHLREKATSGTTIPSVSTDVNPQVF